MSTSAGSTLERAVDSSCSSGSSCGEAAVRGGGASASSGQRACHCAATKAGTLTSHRARPLVRVSRGYDRGRGGCAAPAAPAKPPAPSSAFTAAIAQRQATPRCGPGRTGATDRVVPCEGASVLATHRSPHHVAALADLRAHARACMLVPSPRTLLAVRRVLVVASPVVLRRAHSPASRSPQPTVVSQMADKSKHSSGDKSKQPSIARFFGGAPKPPAPAAAAAAAAAPGGAGSTGPAEGARAGFAARCPGEAGRGAHTVSALTPGWGTPSLSTCLALCRRRRHGRGGGRGRRAAAGAPRLAARRTTRRHPASCWRRSRECERRRAAPFLTRPPASRRR